MDFLYRFVLQTLKPSIMKKIFLLLILCSLTVFSQDKEFKFSKDGITDFIVVEVPGKSTNELYNQTLLWINKFYKNPEKVVLAKVEGDYIRFEGFSNSLLCFNALGKTFYDSTYQIEVSFQDGKYKFDLIEVNLLGTKSDPHMSLTDMSEYYKKSGDIKGTYKYFPEIFPKFFNDINQSLFDYLRGESLKKSKDW